MYILSELTVIIPSKNDHLRIEENFGKILNFLNEQIENFEILIVSNGSIEDSTDYIDNLIKENLLIKHIILQKPGKGLAIKEGILRSKFKNILFTDADLSVDISEFKNFVDKGNLLSGFVIGNRKNVLSQNLKSPFIRKLSGFIYQFILKILLNLEIEDTQCGFKAINKDLFKECIQFETTGFSFDVELLILAIKNTITISEVPVTYVHDSNSQVSVLKDASKMIFEVYKIYKKHNG